MDPALAREGSFANCRGVNLSSRAPTESPRAVVAPRPAPRAVRRVDGVRVALFVNSVEMGGVEEHVRQLATGLVSRGAEVRVICPESSVVDPLAAACAGDGARVTRLTLSRTAGWGGALARLLKLVELLRSDKVDVLHIHLTGAGGGRWVFLASRLAGVPALIYTQQIAPEKRASLPLRLERRLVSVVVHRFIAVSDATRRKYVDRLAQPEAKTIVVPNAVELDRYHGDSAAARLSTRRRWNIPVDAKVIGTVARLSPQKALHVLLEAVPAVMREVPDVQVLIVGDGPERSTLENLAVRLGIASHVHFVGNRTDVPDQLFAMDVFALPSLFEGLPLAILEAMAAGRPVVATAVDGVPEIVEDGVTGFLVSPGDAGSLGRALVRLLQDPAAASRFGEAGRLRAQEFSTEAVIDRVVEAYGVGIASRRFAVAS